jgi:DNA-directed RNA polymerase subunit RPC12/RpoP
MLCVESLLPAGSVGEEEGEMCTGITSSHVLEKEDSPGTCRYPQRSKRRSDSTNMSQEGSQGGARYVEVGEFSQVKVESGDPPRTVQPVERPGGQGAAGVASFGCGVCNKHFQYKSQFLVHQRTHTGERPFRCTSCQKGFMQPSDLRVHQRIHTGEKPYKCRVCHKVFTHESTLLAHRRVHTQEKPYECEDCKKRFSHKGNLNVHRRIHTNSRPYECPECGHAFRQLGTFKRHLKVHSGKTSG